MVILKSDYLHLNKKWIQLKICSREANISDENIGPILGQYGLNSKKFCEDFNERSFFIKKGLLITVFLYFFFDHLTKHIHFFLGYPWTNYILYHALTTYFTEIEDELVEITELNEINDLNLLKLYKGAKILGWTNNTMYYNYFELHNKLYGLKYK